MATTNTNINTLNPDSSTEFVRPHMEDASTIITSMDPSISLSTNISNDLTILAIQLLIRGYGKTSLKYNLGMSFPKLLNQKIYFPFKVAISIDDILTTLGPSIHLNPPDKEELITFFTSPELISQVVTNAKKRLIETYQIDNEYNNYIVSNVNQAIQKGIIKNNLQLLNNLLFLDDSNIFLNKRQFVINDSKELKPQINDFKEQLSKKTPINSILNCNGIIFVSPILEQKTLTSSVTRLNLNLIIRGQRKGIVKNYNPGMSFSSLKDRIIYFPFTIKITKQNLIKALDLEPYNKPTNNDLISVFTRPGLLSLAIKDALKSGEKAVSTIDEANEKGIIQNNLNLINKFLFAPKSLITIYGHNYTIHSSDGISPEINKFKNELITKKNPLTIKLECNIILNVLDSATPSDIEFKRLSCKMRKDLIIQDLEEVLGIEIEKDIKKDIKYLKRAPAISRYEYYKKKGQLYPEYMPPGYFPYYPYLPDYSSKYMEPQTRKVRRRPITESIYRRGPVTTSTFTTRRPTTSSTLDTFSSPQDISPSRFEERPTSRLQEELERRKELEKQRYMMPYGVPYGFIPPVPYAPPPYTKQTRKTRFSPNTKAITRPYPYPYTQYGVPPYYGPSPYTKLTPNRTRKGGKYLKKNKTIKNKYKTKS